jgi:hypothetical protein
VLAVAKAAEAGAALQCIFIAAESYALIALLSLSGFKKKPLQKR